MQGQRCGEGTLCLYPILNEGSELCFWCDFLPPKNLDLCLMICSPRQYLCSTLLDVTATYSRPLPRVARYVSPLLKPNKTSYLTNFSNWKKIVLMRKWDLQEAVRLIEKEKITTAGGIPYLVMGLMSALQDNPDHSLEGKQFSFGTFQHCPTSLTCHILRVQLWWRSSASRNGGIVQEDAC